MLWRAFSGEFLGLLVTSGQITMGRPNWIGLLGQNNQAYHNLPKGGLLGDELAVGWIDCSVCGNKE